jgi:phage FluMu gp28-like protein
MMRQLAAQVPGVAIRESERMITLPTGGTVQIKSADNPDSLRGEGLDFVVLDECAFLKEEAWTEVLRPALADKQGGALFISTPKGRNWFYAIHQRANYDDTWKSFHFTSYDNPFVANSELDAAKEQLPELVYRQEILAEFLTDGLSVFRGIVEAATAPRQNGPTPNSTYVAGVDWALSTDFTVLTIVDATARAVAYVDRFNGIDYSLQRQRIAVVCERFGVTSVLAEENAMGKPNNDELRRMGLPVRDFTTTNASKAELIERLAADFEKGNIKILNDPLLIAELQSFGAERMAGGMTRYSAPSGMHDDMVMSLALSWYAAVKPRRQPSTQRG